MLGKGKFGTVDLIIANGQLKALKRVSKHFLENPKVG